jgi:hypothetical protein
MTGEELEKKIAKYHHRLELVRSIAPVIIITLQCVILYKIFGG